jgi:type II secretory pathway component PulK
MLREPGLWERNKATWITVLAIVLGLSTLAADLRHSRKQLKAARHRQMQLSRMLINAVRQ